MKGDVNKKIKDLGNDIPNWVRYLLIIVAFLWLISFLFRKGSPPRTDFPFF